MKALTVKPLWAWAIIHANKDIENRVKPTHYRGDILIHTSQKCTLKEYRYIKEFCENMGVITVPEQKNLCCGQIIGVVTVVDCQFSTTANGWGMPEYYHWKLKNPRAITPISYIGQLGLFNVPDELIKEVMPVIKSRINA